MIIFKNISYIRNYNLTKQLRFNRFLSSLNLWEEDLTSDIKHKIEKHWKDNIKYDKYIEGHASKEKYYVLPMFPYPSGSLHMGHVRVYTISDAVARYQRMNNKNVLHPIGWDAFGLPAENAAIDRKINPNTWTKENIAHMKTQLENLGCSFDWDREFRTCAPEYYRWTQELFLKLFERGLAYRKEALVNWDPVDKTVLADEQVDENGKSWRSGATVQKKLLKQWYIRTTAFAKSLLDGLDDPLLRDWRDIKKIQRHWIGECDGISFDFRVEGSELDFLTLWTDLPEYIRQVKFIAVSKDNILSRKENLDECRDTVRLEALVKNPFNSETIPVYVTNEISFLDSTDSFVGIPGICAKAEEFANNHNIKFDKINPLNPTEADKKRLEIIEESKKSGIGGHQTSAKLRDWLISRQRYWGTPIPIIHCDACGALPVPRTDLPVVLPDIEHAQKGLPGHPEWVKAACPKCGGAARRETDTMDTFVDSSWYYLRFIDPGNTKEMFNKEKIAASMPVDLYIGGKEHAVLHMYYARFINHFLHSEGLVPEKEPFKRLLVQGMVMGRSYRVKGSGKYLPEKDVEVLDLKKNRAVTKDGGEPVVISWEKMSKSKHNGVDPVETFKEYGTDTTRLLILADVAPTSHRNWNTNTFPGILNWQRRLWLTVRDFLKHRTSPPPAIDDKQFQIHDDYMWDSRNYYVVGTSYNYLMTQQISVAVSKLQGLTNSLRKVPPAVFARSKQFERALAVQIIMLAPMAPHFASELWSGFRSAPNRLNTEEIDWTGSVFDQKWPECDEEYRLNLVCQVNGHENAIVKVRRSDLEKLSKEEAFNIAMGQKEVQETLVRRNVLDNNFTLYEGFEGIINIITDQPPPRSKETSDEPQIV
ncbi:unnamed protein product [Phyllotreta striolata]|uniref:leucine--tRNA ligase n=1 Tax=Phyllotreta striolata TaxID=444603 RepID=A0A9N9XLZ4_PHYSR|nr:unnamed protein product [Phyllotreta striolata]